MVTIKDVARRAEVSVGTVSNVINHPDIVSVEIRTRVSQAIADLGYVRSESARQLRLGHSRVIGLLVLNLANPFFVEMAKGAERAARAAGLKIMLCHSGQDPAEEAEYLSLFVEQRVRGVLLTPADVRANGIDLLHRYRVPYVLADWRSSDQDTCSVWVDDQVGGQMATRHLIDNGHRDIAYIGGPAALAQCRHRAEGARAAIAAAGLPPASLTVLEVDQMDVVNGRDAGARLLGLATRPTAVFCVNDLIALGVLQAMFSAGVRVPQDVAIVGYDDIEFAAAAAVPLSSVRQPAFRIGQRATELLIDTIEHPTGHTHSQVVFQPELVVRGSSMIHR